MADLYPQKSHLPAGPLESPDFSRIPYESIHEKYYYYVQILDNVPAPTRGSKTPKTPKTPKTAKPPTEYVGQVTEKEDSFITFKPIYRRTQGRAWSTLEDPSDETFFSLAIDLPDDQIPTGYATPFFRRVSTRPGATPNAYSRNMSALRTLQQQNVGLVGMAPFVTPRSKSKTRKGKKSRRSRTQRGGKTRRSQQRGSDKTCRNKQRGGTLIGYKGQCKTNKSEFGDRAFSGLMARLNGEMRRMPKEDMNAAGIYLKFEEHMGEGGKEIGFYCMIQNKDAGPYSHTPMCFTVKVCAKDGSLYPMIPPIVEFMSFSPQRIHPNLKPSGDVCISILSYSYVGPSAGVSVWSPATTISSLMMTLGSLLTDKALKYEPGFERSDEVSIQKYDTQLEYLCMKEIVKTYSDLAEGRAGTVALNHFSDQLRTNAKDALQYVMDKTAGKETIPLERSTFIEAFSANYKSLHEKATELLTKF